MNTPFVEIVEEAKQLTTEEKQELRDLLDSYLVEEKREGIFDSYQKSKQESLKFSSDLDELKEMLND